MPGWNSALNKGTQMAEENRNLFSNPDIEIKKPEPITIKGFLLSLAMVFAIMGLTLWLASIGR